MKARRAPPPPSSRTSSGRRQRPSVASPPLRRYYPAPFGVQPPLLRASPEHIVMRRSIVAGNWKMHGSRAENARLVEELLAAAPAAAPADCVVCPPLVYLQEVGRLLRDSLFRLGAQDVCADPQGAFTGEVSAAMLKDVGCEYVIVGHSER